ncbi:unnamed protein product [marine sediment metagenome]|uniref:Uncharacterized protein n=1 Tax=marine sediment metagenome TaxID=412755 RepID=X0SYF5_9ZZZZ
MSGGTLLIVVVTGVLAILSGWLVPIVFKSKRPYGLLGDILVCTVPAVALSFAAWQWILPALGFTSGWIKVLGAIGDPLALGWICLWIVRKIKS